MINVNLYDVTFISPSHSTDMMNVLAIVRAVMSDSTNADEAVLRANIEKCAKLLNILALNNDMLIITPKGEDTHGSYWINRTLEKGDSLYDLRFFHAFDYVFVYQVHSGDEDKLQGIEKPPPTEKRGEIYFVNVFDSALLEYVRECYFNGSYSNADHVMDVAHYFKVAGESIDYDEVLDRKVLEVASEARMYGCKHICFHDATRG